MDKGLRTAIVALSENTRDIVVAFRRGNLTTENKRSLLNEE